MGLHAGSHWADWVRGLRAFDHPTWHYINYPIIEAGSALKAADHEPPAKQQNVVIQVASLLNETGYRGLWQGPECPKIRGFDASPKRVLTA